MGPDDQLVDCGDHHLTKELLVQAICRHNKTLALRHVDISISSPEVDEMYCIELPGGIPQSLFQQRSQQRLLVTAQHANHQKYKHKHVINVKPGARH